MLPLFHKMCYCSAIQKSRFGPAGNGNGMLWVAPDTAVFIGIRDKEVYELRIVLCVPLTEKEELEAALRDAYGAGDEQGVLVVFTDRDAFIRDIREHACDTVIVSWNGAEGMEMIRSIPVPYCVICEEARFGRGDPGHSPMVPGMEKAKWKW